jgi:hypothetical protein
MVVTGFAGSPTVPACRADIAVVGNLVDIGVSPELLCESRAQLCEDANQLRAALGRRLGEYWLDIERGKGREVQVAHREDSLADSYEGVRGRGAKRSHAQFLSAGAAAII